MNMVSVNAIPLAKILGKSEKSKFTYLKGFGVDIEFGYYCWLVQDGNQKILIDAGATADQAVNLWGRPSNTVEHIQSLEEGLNRLGTSTKEITKVVLTHLHMDHIAYIHDLLHAEILVQTKEWRFASKPQSIDKYYDSKFIEGIEFTLLDGDSNITDNLRVIFTPGHTPGGQSVCVSTENGTCVITGFCCIQENFGSCGCESSTNDITIPGIHQNSMDSFESMRRVQKIADIIVANHDAKYISEPNII